MVSLLSLLSGGIIMVIYSVMSAKPYSKRLLAFAYNKPLYAVVLFVVELVALALLAKSFAGIDFPLMGSAIIQLPQTITHGTNFSVPASGALEWPFYFAIAAAVLCVAARLYHGKLTKTILPPPPTIN